MNNDHETEEWWVDQDDTDLLGTDLFDAEEELLGFLTGDFASDAELLGFLGF